MDRTITCCPLCEFEDEQTAVYQHLQISHRKSELSRKILADAGEADRIEVIGGNSGTAD